MGRYTRPIDVTGPYRYKDGLSGMSLTCSANTGASRFNLALQNGFQLNR